MRLVVILLLALYAAIAAVWLLGDQALLVADVQLSASIFAVLAAAAPVWAVLSLAGSAVLWLVAAAVLFFVGQLWRTVCKHCRKAGALLFFGTWLNVGIAALLKITIARPRPPWQLVELEPELFAQELVAGSLPSGHAQLVFMAAIILGNFFPRAKLPLLLLAVVVALSRVALGSHYVLDVIVGSLNGVLIGLLWLALPWDRIKHAIKR